jgi:hypothetical protein
MTIGALETFAERLSSVWGPLTTELVAECRKAIVALTSAPVTEPWLEALYGEMAARTELYTDPVHGFVLLAHAEPAGLYRAPHDHGRGWVIYAVLAGEIEMGSYGQIPGKDGAPRLAKRDATLVRPGKVQVYLPGDIHDTMCLSGPALLLRFSDRDLQVEDRIEHRVTRYVESDGVWTTGTR